MNSPPAPRPAQQPPTTSYFRPAILTLVLFVLFAAWDTTPLDLAMARWFGGPAGFPLRDHWLWATVLHQGARRVAWALQFVLLLSVWWPFGVLRTLTRQQRAHMFVAAMLILAAVASFKNINATSCPWDLTEFGGVAAYVSHWSWGVRDGGVGRCFPAGHASAAFCFLPGYFWLREKSPRQARIWLIVTLVAGFTIGMAQQVRGAHYLSHTLWTGWLSWVVAALSHGLLEHRSRRRSLARAAKPDLSAAPAAGAIKPPGRS